MRMAFIGAFISITVIMFALGGIAWTFYSSPSSYTMESDGLQSVIDLERQAMSDDFYSQSQD